MAKETRQITLLGGDAVQQALQTPRQEELSLPRLDAEGGIEQASDVIQDP
jgi:hypothetical protein